MERKGEIRSGSYRKQMGTDMDPFCFQKLKGDTACDAQRSGKASGKVTSAPKIHIITVLQSCRQIRMRRSGGIPETLVVGGMLIGIADHRS